MSYQILHSVCEAPLDMPAKDLDLPQWLFQLSDTEYQKCSKGHLAAGASILTDANTSANQDRIGHPANRRDDRPDHLRPIANSSLRFNPTAKRPPKVLGKVDGAARLRYSWSTTDY